MKLTLKVPAQLSQPSRPRFGEDFNVQAISSRRHQRGSLIICLGYSCAMIFETSICTKSRLCIGLGQKLVKPFLKILSVSFTPAVHFYNAMGVCLRIMKLFVNRQLTICSSPISWQGHHTTRSVPLILRRNELVRYKEKCQRKKRNHRTQ